MYRYKNTNTGDVVESPTKLARLENLDRWERISATDLEHERAAASTEVVAPGPLANDPVTIAETGEAIDPNADAGPDDDPPVYGRNTVEATGTVEIPEDLAPMRRGDLDDLATRLGVDGAADLSNKGEVIEAIREKQASLPAA